MSVDEERLYQLHRVCFELYAIYRRGELDEETYLGRIKLIDREIEELEMIILQGSPAWKALSSTSPPKRGN